MQIVPMIHTEPDYYGPGSLVLCAADEYEEICTTIGLNVDPAMTHPILLQRCMHQ